jgi:chorismate dehydratase
MPPVFRVRTVRYGAVSYLNSKPLIEGLAPLVLDTPARLVRRFEEGEVDVALLPVAAGEGAGLTRVGSLGIAADGPVDSVLVFLARPAAEVETLALDPASRTSRVLAQIVLRRGYGRTPRLVDPPADAELVIGDAALVRAAGDEPFLDLAVEWRRLTGLSFVFAAWYGAPGAEAALEEAYERGRGRLAVYAREAGLDLPADALERYLRERIVFRLGPREEAGLARFLEEGRALGLL